MPGPVDRSSSSNMCVAPDPTESTETTHEGSPTRASTSAVAPTHAASSAISETADVAEQSAGAEQLVEASKGASRAAQLAVHLSRGGDSSNAERTWGRAPQAYAEAGVTEAGDVIYAGAALGKGETPDGAVEVLSASVQTGAQQEGQITAVRMDIGKGSERLTLEALELETHAGAHNPDGSVGLNGGAALTIAGAELTVESSGNSATAGVSAGAAAELSVGIRDADEDGEVEVCARVATGPWTFGACIEPSGVIAAIRGEQ